MALIALSAGLAIAKLIPGDHAVIASGILTVLYKAMRTFVKVRASADAAMVEIAAMESGSSGAPAVGSTSNAQPPTSNVQGGEAVRTVDSLFPGAAKTAEEDSETVNRVRHGFASPSVLATIVWIASALLLAFVFAGCASTSVYRGGQKIFTTQADAGQLEFHDGGTSLTVQGLNHSTPTRAGGSVIGTAGSAVTAAAAAIIAK